MENKITPLVDEHLASLHGMQVAEAGDYFYSRLRNRMEVSEKQTIWRFPVRPAYILSTLVLLLAINGFMLTQQYRAKHISSNKSTNSIERFAQAYDQTINATY